MTRFVPLITILSNPDDKKAKHPIYSTDSGIIRESIIKFDEDIAQNQVDDLTYIFRNKLVGKPLETMNSPLEEFIMEEMQTGINIIKKVIEEINKIILDSQAIFLDGANKVVDMPEFKKVDVAKDFLNVLDAKDLVADVLNTGLADNINIYIGEETEKEELKNFSIVTFNHLLEDKTDKDFEEMLLLEIDENKGKISVLEEELKISSGNNRPHFTAGSFGSNVYSALFTHHFTVYGLVKHNLD